MAKRSKKGGNPVGRPKGSYGRFRSMLLAEGDKLIETAIASALAGDSTMLKYCMECIVPKLRSQAAPVRVDAASNDISDVGAAILRSGLTGDVSTDAVRDLLAALADVARLREFSELEERLAALEQTQSQPPWQIESTAIEKLPLRSKKRQRRRQCEPA